MKSSRPKKKSVQVSDHLTFSKMPFSLLIQKAEDLAELRRKFASKPAQERQFAADWEYNAAVAAKLFNQAIGFDENDDTSPWPGAVIALAIDPQYAPALLTVASYEYLYGRINEAMTLFLTLPTLPAETEDLAEIIDKAGDFLLDQEDYENARSLYSAAVCQFPKVALYHNGLSYCLAQLGRLDEAIEHDKRAVNLDPDNYKYLSDLGWSLLEAERFEEAQTILERAVTLSPPEYELARGNLEELHSRRKS